jgi:hypothetical protein
VPGHEPTAGDEEIVRALLGVAGLEPSDEEVQRLVAAYTGHRSAVDKLYAVPMSKEERPQPVFGFAGETSDDSG